MRPLFCIAVLLTLTVSASGQDMQVKDFVLPNETWQRVAFGDFGVPGPEAATPSGVKYVFKNGGGDVGKKLFRIEPDGQTTEVKGNVGDIESMVFRADQNALIVSQKIDGRHQITSYFIQKDGTLGARENYYTPQRHPTRPFTGARLAIDDKNCLYAATDRGVQIFDPIGRLAGVIELPSEGPQTINLIKFHGNDLIVLWGGDTLYKRKMKSQGVGAPK